jgi:hypothetical protein
MELCIFLVGNNELHNKTDTLFVNTSLTSLSFQETK